MSEGEYHAKNIFKGHESILEQHILVGLVILIQTDRKRVTGGVGRGRSEEDMDKKEIKEMKASME